MRIMVSQKQKPLCFILIYVDEDDNQCNSDASVNIVLRSSEKENLYFPVYVNANDTLQVPWNYNTSLTSNAIGLFFTFNLILRRYIFLQLKKLVYAVICVKHRTIKRNLICRYHLHTSYAT